MSEYQKALAAAREADDKRSAALCALLASDDSNAADMRSALAEAERWCAHTQRYLIAAIDAQKPVKWMDHGHVYDVPCDDGSSVPLYASPPAVLNSGNNMDADDGHTRASLEQAPPAAAVSAENVTPLRQPRADLARLVESINTAVYDNAKGLSVTEAIGALELAKLELLKEQEQ